MNDQELTILLKELNLKIEKLKCSLPQKTPILFCKSVDPSRAMIFREACLHRITELCESAYDAFAKKRLITAFILCRAFMETETLFWSFIDMLKNSLQTRKTDEIRNFLSKCLAGIKDKEIKKFRNPEESNKVPDPINVLTLIQKTMGNAIKHYPLHYASLCEFTHPNAAGTVDAYVAYDWKENIATFRTNTEKLKEEQALPHLVASLEAFICLYNESATQLEEFIELCESLVPLP